MYIVELINKVVLPGVGEVRFNTIIEKYVARCFSPDNSAFPIIPFSSGLAVQISPKLLRR